MHRRPPSRGHFHARFMLDDTSDSGLAGITLGRHMPRRIRTGDRCENHAPHDSHRFGAVAGRRLVMPLAGAGQPARRVAHSVASRDAAAARPARRRRGLLSTSGRRVIVDAYTGEVLASSRPARCATTAPPRRCALTATGRTTLDDPDADMPATAARLTSRGSPVEPRIRNTSGRPDDAGGRFSGRPAAIIPRAAAGTDAGADRARSRSDEAWRRSADRRCATADRRPATNRPSVLCRRARTSPSCRSCSTARALRPASSTGGSAPMSTRRLPPIARSPASNLQVDRHGRPSRQRSPRPAAMPS